MILTGPDVSNNNGKVDWSQVARQGHSFAAAKCTEGKSYADPLFAANWTAIKAVSLVRIAYHYCHPDRNMADVEAAWFLQHCKLEPGDMVMLDYEIPPYTLAWAQRFAHLIPATTILYYPASHAAAFAGWLGPRWPASYPGPDGRPHRPAKPWQFWQYTDKATVAGVFGGCDLSQYDGTLDQLHALAGVPSPPPAAPIYDYPEDAVKSTLLTIGPLDDGGNGFKQWDPGFGRDPIIVSAVKEGPYPPTDGYAWPDDHAQTLDVSAQAHGGTVIVTVRGGKPHGTYPVFVTAA